MMTEEHNKTESLILDAAKKVFIRKGYDGSRMQEIADEAGINKALLHYYFRSKDNLFDAIFLAAFAEFIPNIGLTIMSDKPIKDKLKTIIGNYIDMLTANPFIPHFILQEINRNPQRIVSMMHSRGLNPEIFKKVLYSEVGLKTWEMMNPEHLMINIVSMCVFPFAAKPILMGFVFNNDEERFQNFINERKQVIYDVIVKSLEI
jgi:TetR/AcrR family transcriptional regulator